MRVLFNRKIVKMIKNPRVRNKTITLYVFNKMKLKENWVVFLKALWEETVQDSLNMYINICRKLMVTSINAYGLLTEKGVEIPGKT